MCCKRKPANNDENNIIIIIYLTSTITHFFIYVNRLYLKKKLVENK